MVMQYSVLLLLEDDGSSLLTRLLFVATTLKVANLREPFKIIIPALKTV